MPGGADGQFYLRLAFNPFTPQQNEHGIRLDNPPYRQQRLLYSLLAWLLAVGQPPLFPAMLIAINYAGLCTLAWIGARLAQSLGRSPAWGFSFHCTRALSYRLCETSRRSWRFASSLQGCWRS